jgi:hypothetical protein
MRDRQTDDDLIQAELERPLRAKPNICREQRKRALCHRVARTHREHREREAGHARHHGRAEPQSVQDHRG